MPPNPGTIPALASALAASSALAVDSASAVPPPTNSVDAVTIEPMKSFRISITPFAVDWTPVQLHIKVKSSCGEMVTGASIAQGHRGPGIGGSYS